MSQLLRRITRLPHGRSSRIAVSAFVVVAMTLSLAAVSNGAVSLGADRAASLAAPAPAEDCADERTAATAAKVALGKAKDRVRNAKHKVKPAVKRLTRARKALRQAKAHGSAADVRKAAKSMITAKKKVRATKNRLDDAHKAVRRADQRADRMQDALRECLDVAATLYLKSAELQGPGEVLLTFNKPLGDSADDVASYTSSPDLFITGAARLSSLDQVVLHTGTLFAIDYTVSAAGVLDVAGEPINPAHASATFTGTEAVDAERPKVTTAGATGNTTMVVQFSKPMGDSAVDPLQYSVVREPDDARGVDVTAARFTNDARTSVELTTGSQSEVMYRVRVADITDVTGLPMAERVIVNGQVILDPTSAVFAGRPPGPEDRVDSDCDGLFDHEESAGWQVHIELATGGEAVRDVSSDPGTPGMDCESPEPADDADGDGVPDAQDTDRDGLDDTTEKSLVTDPRDEDTDDDGLSDYVEFNEIYSDPVGQDSDGDSITDGLEVTFFITSATLDDTDGDQIHDGDEVNLGNRNPNVADLPKPAVEIGEMDLGLDVRFVDVSGTESKVAETRQVTSTLQQTESPGVLHQRPADHRGGHEALHHGRVRGRVRRRSDRERLVQLHCRAELQQLLHDEVHRDLQGGDPGDLRGLPVLERRAGRAGQPHPRGQGGAGPGGGDAGERRRHRVHDAQPAGDRADPGPEGPGAADPGGHAAADGRAVRGLQPRTAGSRAGPDRLREHPGVPAGGRRPDAQPAGARLQASATTTSSTSSVATSRSLRRRSTTAPLAWSSTTAGSTQTTTGPVTSRRAGGSPPASGGLSTPTATARSTTRTGARSTTPTASSSASPCATPSRGWA